MATIHIVHGYIAFGKTTLAKKLAAELPAVHLDVDEWIVALYGKHLSDKELDDKFHIVVDFLWQMARKIIYAGSDVIMDIGPWSRKMRQDAAKKAYDITPNVVFHTIILDLKIARCRLIERNKKSPIMDASTVAFFDEYLSLYEPISDDEGFVVKRYYQSE